MRGAIMDEENKNKLATEMKQAFAKAGVHLDEDVIHQVLKAACESCWSVGCKEGCDSGCLSSCKTGKA
jgi:hypothetical protein